MVTGTFRTFLDRVLWSTLLLLVATPVAAQSEPAITACLSAGEFGPARQLADSLPNSAGRDQMLGRIATAQSNSGARRASLETAYEIRDDRLRSSTFGQLAAQPIGHNLRRGGAALADFDSLIDLITTTVEPESWDTVGGPGAVESFPTGVSVDSLGVFRRLSSDELALTSVHSRALPDGGNRDMLRPSALRKISLTRLERHAQMQWAMGKRPDEAMRLLAGMYQVKYVLFYPETRDIVLAGPAGPWETREAARVVNRDTGKPVLHLDDLVVTLRNAVDDDGRFGCAITPSQERLAAVQQFLDESSTQPLHRSRRQAWIDDLRDRLGFQDISVFGIDPRTRAARILVEADYHMKLIGMGLAEGTLGVQSYLDSITVGPDGSLPKMDVLRWWFTLNYEGLRTNATRDAFELVGPGVRVLSENELLDARGERIHTGESDVLNQRFAHSFTRHYDHLSDKYPIYADLRNIFDLAVVAGVIRSESLGERVDWEWRHFRDSKKYAVDLGREPRQVASVINHREIGRKQLLVGVSGGVSVNTLQENSQTLLSDEYGTVDATHRGSDPSEVPSLVWWWD